MDSYQDFTPVTTSTKMAKLVYILYIIGIVFGITGIVGVVISYVYQGDAPHWLQSHYRFQIRTFWIGLLYLVVGVILSFILVGYLVMLFWIIWLLVRCIKGLRLLDQQREHPNPAGWFFN